MLLPTKEYSALCHAIRTRYGNKIPSDGFIFHGDYFYRYNFDEEIQKICCKLRMRIRGNEDLINVVMSELFEED